MSEGFTGEWATDAIERLADAGMTIAPGLRQDELDAIADAFGVALPNELRLLLSAGLPTSQSWVRWKEDPTKIAQEAAEWLDRAFAFDIEHDDYWHPRLGERPAELDAAIAQASHAIRAAPPLIPIYAHRFLTTHVPGPRAVLSVWQAGDSIFYGFDLADYLHREFAIERPTWSTSDVPAVPIWEELFDL